MEARQRWSSRQRLIRISRRRSLRWFRSLPPKLETKLRCRRLLIAIKRTDYRTALNDRETAMAARWVLQDIRSIDQGCHRSVRLIFRDCKNGKLNIIAVVISDSGPQ